MYDYLTKGIDGTGIVTDINAKDGVIEGYFSVFGNVDSDGDMIMPGAFKKTLIENSKRQKHLWQHNPSQPLSNPIMSEDSKGLKFHSVISQTTYGKNAIRLYNDGVIDEHSIGFNVIKQQKKGNYNEMTELRLWEGSSVTWAANEFAIGGPVKSLTKDQAIARFDVIYKALRNGKYEGDEGDEIFHLLDIYHQQLKQYIIDLSTTPAAEAQEPEASADNGLKSTLISLTDFLKN